MNFLATIVSIFIPVPKVDPERDGVMFGTFLLIVFSVVAGVRDFLKGGRRS